MHSFRADGSARNMASVLTEAPSTGGVDFKHITHLHLNLADVRELLHRAVNAHHPVDAR